MKIDNGRRVPLEIEGVFSGLAGVRGPFVSFIPNRAGKRADAARGGILDGKPVTLDPMKDPTGPFWTSRFEVLA